MSFSSSSASSGGKKGKDWTYKIYFAPEADNRSGKVYEIEREKLELLNIKERSSRLSKLFTKWFWSETDRQRKYLYEEMDLLPLIPSVANVDHDTDEDGMSSDLDGKEDDELIEKPKELLHVEETIENIWAYKHALWKRQLTKIILYHMFILFETKNWWWSIEKNCEGITIQRSKYKECVLKQYRQKIRPSVAVMERDTGTRSMTDLIKWLCRENELNKEYNVISSNCKDFGKAVFNHVATCKKL